MPAPLNSQVSIIGSGFAGLAAACCLAQAGHSVHIYEKNATLGGRARIFEKDGFRFDMGPSWYWMPDVFDKFFKRFNKSTKDYYELIQLDPSYSIIFEQDEVMDVPASMDALYEVFESYEKGSSRKLQKFLANAAYKYKVGVDELVYKPSLSVFEFVDIRLLFGMFKMGVFQSYFNYVRKYFKEPKLLKLMEFPLLFLGAVPQNTPALYSLMNYAGLNLGTWYPMGGMHKIIEGMVRLAGDLGVTIHTNAEVEKIEVKNGHATGLVVNGKSIPSDVVVGAADYQHIEQNLLPQELRQYDEKYWDNRVMAPSSLIFYLGVNRKVDRLQHHNLFFDKDFTIHAREIYEDPSWPSDPLFYVCCPSKTDDSVAPDGCENLFLLVPIAPGLEDTDAIREKYFDMVMERLQKYVGYDIRESLLYKRSYAVKDFEKDYHSYKGNAYGLANTLRQTAILKPSMKNPKVSNLFFAGQLTVPGPGVPPSLISGQVAADQVINYLNH